MLEALCPLCPFDFMLFGFQLNIFLYFFLLVLAKLMHNGSSDIYIISTAVPTRRLIAVQH